MKTFRNQLEDRSQVVKLPSIGLPGLDFYLNQVLAMNPGVIFQVTTPTICVGISYCNKLNLLFDQEMTDISLELAIRQVCDNCNLKKVR